MAEVKPLKLKRESARAGRSPALSLPYARVLVDHQILHLDYIFDYIVPEEFSKSAEVGSLVEVELGHSRTQGILLERSDASSTTGDLKEIIKVLSSVPYVLPQQLELIMRASQYYGASPWDFITSCVPPFSTMGERRALEPSSPSVQETGRVFELPQSLLHSLHSHEKLICAVETPLSTPYWKLLAAIAIARSTVGDVLVISPNERELTLLETELTDQGFAPLVISSTSGKSERYLNYLRARAPHRKIIIGTRSSALLPLDGAGTVIVQDDVDESHYERAAPTWNTRELLHMREAESSVIYVSATLSLEIAARINAKDLLLYRFPDPMRIRVQSAEQEGSDGYFSIIGEGLKRGSVLVSVGATGYVTSFSCQKCRNTAQCTCGGKLYFPARATHPLCATCSTQYIEWTCTWCGESKPRILRSGVIRRAEEFGRAFPRQSVISSSAQNSIPLLPEGRHLVLSTPGMEPRGSYAAAVFLDLEGRLLRTTLRATEELRLSILRTLSMVEPGGVAYLALTPAENFLQSLLRRNTLETASREIEERDAVALPPHFFTAVISGESIETALRVLESVSDLQIIGPFLRAGKKAILLKAPQAVRTEIVQLLVQINRVQSARRDPLLSYRLDPYSLN